MASVGTIGEPLIASARNGDDEPLFEIIDGERVELPPMSFYACIIASRLLGEISSFAKAQNLGQAVMETLIRLALPVDRNRRPDVAFISYKRWPKGKPQSLRGNAWDVVPELGIEVISPNDLGYDILVRLDEYFRAGMKLVWVVYPNVRVVYVYSSFTTVQVFARNDTLDGGEVLPGFRLALAELFTEEVVDPRNENE